MPIILEGLKMLTEGKISEFLDIYKRLDEDKYPFAKVVLGVLLMSSNPVELIDNDKIEIRKTINIIQERYSPGMMAKLNDNEAEYGVQDVFSNAESEKLYPDVTLKQQLRILRALLSLSTKEYIVKG